LNTVAALQIILFHLYSLQENEEVGGFGISDLPYIIVQVADNGDWEANAQLLHFLQ
jgi:hypothetical protein